MWVYIWGEMLDHTPAEMWAQDHKEMWKSDRSKNIHDESVEENTQAPQPQNEAVDI